MKIEYRTVTHPRLHNRDITFIFINNKIDLPSARFLIYEARYGSWFGDRRRCRPFGYSGIEGTTWTHGKPGFGAGFWRHS